MNITNETALATGLRRHDGSASTARIGERALPHRDGGSWVEERPLPVASGPVRKGFRSW